MTYARSWICGRVRQHGALRDSRPGINCARRPIAMAVQALVSLAILGLVIARAVNVFT